MVRFERRSSVREGSVSAGELAAARPWLGCLIGLLWSCGTNNSYYQEIVIVEADAGPPAAAPAAPDESGGGAQPAGLDQRPPLTPGGGVEPLGAGNEGEKDPPILASGAPAPDVKPSELALNVFGVVGNHFYFEASEKQVEQMNAPYLGNGYYGDFYTPLGGYSADTYVDHLFITSAGKGAHTADFGKVQVRLVGQSTGRPWTESSLPNFKLDADEFSDGNTIGGVKHMRLNNAVVGSIYRERLAFDLYRALGYPAPRVTYAWVSGSVWGPDVDVPYIAVESYKPQFCKLREAELGGGCANMWEFYGDFGQGVFDQAASCQFSECDATRVRELDALVLATPPGEGFKAALSEWLDWDAFHRFQCLSWMIETPDDYIHALNNVVLVERMDGKFQFLPYSVDFSFDHDWGPSADLAGGSLLAMGCQSDPGCWDDTIAACENLVDGYASADPAAMLDSIQAELEQAGMLRDGDDGRYELLREGLERRLTELPAELELNRDAPYLSYCYYPYEQCGDTCVLPGECPICEPEPDGGGAVPPVEEATDAGVADVPAQSEPPIVEPEQPVACQPPLDFYPVGVVF
jgi:hypothetical protein